MKILALSDLHGSRRAAAASLKFIREGRPELVAIAGDLTNWGPAGFAAELLEAIPVRVLAVPGNMDTGELRWALNRGMAQNIDLKKEVVDGITFVGLGGWINSPSLGESWGIEPDEAERALSGLMSEGCVLLTHVPPLGHLDGVPVPDVFAPGGSEEHIGSAMVLRLVQRFNPRLVISGHVHENRGFENLGGTVFVNPGPAKHGFAAMIDISDKVQVIMLEAE